MGLLLEMKKLILYCTCIDCFAEVLSDRFAIKSGNADNVVLSAQQLVDCDTHSQGCNGGFPLQAWEYYMTEVG